MQKSIISWTNATWNPVAGCSKVSDGCKFCYAAALSERYGWTTKPWTIQNEAENVRMKPHKLFEPYKLKEPTRVFVNSMSDMFHRAIPDWYRAAIFCVMLDQPQHTFQVLTKRADATVDWHERFLEAVKHPAFENFITNGTDKRVRIALVKGLNGEFKSPWGDNIWMGTSVEDARVVDRIQQLQQSKAKVRFISAEPLIGAWPEHVDLTGIDWVIVGGESGNHMTADNPRWMKQEWARHIRDLCVPQSVAYFFKQDSGIRTEMRPYLVEEDGSKWTWAHNPGNLEPAVLFEGATTQKPKQEQPKNEPEPPKPEAKKTTLINIKAEGGAHWGSSDFVYIGRANGYTLQQSDWANPYKIEKDTPEARAQSIAKYRVYITERIAKGELDIEELRGKILACWCSPKPCHGDVLLELLGETKAKPEPAKEPEQLALFAMPTINKHRYD